VDRRRCGDHAVAAVHRDGPGPGRAHVHSGILPCTDDLERLEGAAWVDVAPPDHCELVLEFQGQDTIRSFARIAPEASGTYRLALSVSLEERRPPGGSLRIHSPAFEVLDD
jgi:hypothetical protein